jgi:ribosomal protein S18 acetylase RimI-like enzyme
VTDSWAIEKLHRRHDRAAFSCGVTELDDYLRLYATQNEKTSISQHFVAVPAPGHTRILGYYALSAGAVAFDQIPDDLKKRLPRYPIPIAHIGRLAVDQSMQGQGLGEDLLIDALLRILLAADEIGIHAVEVLATNDQAKNFYQKYGFTPLPENHRHLYLPLAHIRKLRLI